MGGLESKVFVSHKDKHYKKTALLPEPTLSDAELDILESSWGKLKKRHQSGRSGDVYEVSSDSGDLVHKTLIT